MNQTVKTLSARALMLVLTLTRLAARLLPLLTAPASAVSTGTILDAIFDPVGAFANEQCKGFAKKVHMILFGYNIGSTKSKLSNYQISISSGNTALVGSLFSKARAGDFIQVRHSHGGSHSMIFLSSDTNGVTVHECNVDNRNGIQIATYSHEQFCRTNAAVSVYTAKDYRLH